MQCITKFFPVYTLCNWEGDVVMVETVMLSKTGLWLDDSLLRLNISIMYLLR